MRDCMCTQFRACACLSIYVPIASETDLERCHQKVSSRTQCQVLE